MITLSSSTDFSSVQAEVEIITPTIAKKYLQHNFSDNRAISKDWVKELAREMKTDLFTISSDCIAFDDRNRIINGQHRLSAVVESNTNQPFIVVRGLPPEVAQLIDVGKKRTMAARITIGGTRITEKQCSTVRNALIDYNSNEVGTVAFAHKRHDQLIEQTFLNHSDYMHHPLIAKFEGKGSSFWSAAALRIFAEMTYKINNGYKFKHDYSPLMRSLFWLELVKNGISENFHTDPLTDSAAIKISKMRDKSTQDNRGSRWSSKADLRLTMSAAWHFMMGNPVQTIRPHGSDPFISLLKLPSTNNSF